MPHSFTPFAWGFRPFFLLAGIYAVVSVAGWLAVYRLGVAPFGPLTPTLWHGHEMLFGFIAAAIAGFVLTAVPNWTGTRSLSGLPLAMLAGAWLAGRLAIAMAGYLPFAVVAIAALLFMPMTIVAIGRVLLFSQDRRVPILVALVAFWASDVAFIFAIGSGSAAAASTALRVGIDIVLVLITIIGGRVVPAFTVNALRKRGVDVAITPRQWLDRGVLLATLAYLVADMTMAGTAWIPVTGFIAGILHLWRLAGWHGLKTWREPIVWILHVAYAALPAGLLMRGMTSLGVSWALHWQHMLTIGAASTMILAITSRAALGHTGRPLRVAKPVILAYGVLLLATLVRVFGWLPGPLEYRTTIMIAGGLWVLAFAIYTAVYAPILVRPRADAVDG